MTQHSTTKLAGAPEPLASGTSEPSAPPRRTAATVASVGLGLLGLLLYAAAIVFHPGWVIPLAEAGVVAMFIFLFAASR
jgi:hypothetical protein